MLNFNLTIGICTNKCETIRPTLITDIIEWTYCTGGNEITVV